MSRQTAHADALAEVDALIAAKRAELAASYDGRVLPLMVRIAMLGEGAATPREAPAELPPAPDPGRGGQAAAPAATAPPDEPWLDNEAPPQILPAPGHLAEWLRIHRAWRSGRIAMGYLERARDGATRPTLVACLRAWGYSRLSGELALARLTDAGALDHDEATDSWRVSDGYRAGIRGEPIAIDFKDKGGVRPRAAEGDARHG